MEIGWGVVDRPAYPRSLQWGHRLSAMEITPITRASSTALRLQWGHRLSAMEIRTATCSSSGPISRFNGATAFRRWRYVRSGPFTNFQERGFNGPPPFGDGDIKYGFMSSGVERASMGPPPFGDGD